jgi:hypothetical protein
VHCRRGKPETRAPHRRPIRPHPARTPGLVPTRPGPRGRIGMNRSERMRKAIHRAPHTRRIRVGSAQAQWRLEEIGGRGASEGEGKGGRESPRARPRSATRIPCTYRTPSIPLFFRSTTRGPLEPEPYTSRVESESGRVGLRPAVRVEPERGRAGLRESASKSQAESASEPESEFKSNSESESESESDSEPESGTDARGAISGRRSHFLRLDPWPRITGDSAASGWRGA